MTIQHIFYIPTIFLLGFIFGIIFNEKRLSGINNNSDTQKHSSRKVLFTFLIFIIIFIITHLFEIPLGSKQVSVLLNGQEIFDKKPLFSSSEVYAKVRTFSKEGLRVYKLFIFTIDVLFPLSFFAFLFTLARYVSYEILFSKKIKRLISYLPVLWLASDFLENFIIYIILSEYPNRYDFLGNTIGLVTATKFSLLICSIIVPTTLLAYSKLGLKKIVKL